MWSNSELLNNRNLRGRQPAALFLLGNGSCCGGGGELAWELQKEGRRAQAAPGKARPWAVRATGRHRIPDVQKQRDEIERMG